ncbi:MAG TPA: L,D-transpeptidase [Nocardioidaceae bacterium]|nr:L,D-transpeptidase [Nocardioidaceae bacterium]
MGRPPEPHASRRAAAPRPRYGRMAAAAGALAVTVVATLGGTGVLPTGSSRAAAAPRPAAVQMAQPVDAGPSGSSGASPSPVAVEGPPLPGGRLPAYRTAGRQLAPPVPAGSGTGRRVVFDITTQRVWLVDRVAGRDVVVRTYLVSGSLTHNLEPGTYAVYSRSLHAWGIDDSGSMGYMVRFAHGPNAAIGFHDIPVLHGKRLQTRAQLGTPQSHGCIRQARPDARALWRFAPTGTEVVVT